MGVKRKPLEVGLQLKIRTPSKACILKLNINNMNLNCLAPSKHAMFIFSQVSLEKVLKIRHDVISLECIYKCFPFLYWKKCN